MAYTDKCCGVCDTYQELKDTGISYFALGEVFTKFKRFKECNVCCDCLNSVKLTGIKYKIVKLTHTVDRSKGFITYVDLATNLIRKAHASRFDDTSKQGKEHPWLFQYETENTCIYSSDKRKLKRVLRKLGVVNVKGL